MTIERDEAGCDALYRRWRGPVQAYAAPALSSL
jgi:hypothetical protein